MYVEELEVRIESWEHTQVLAYAGYEKCCLSLARYGRKMEKLLWPEKGRDENLLSCYAELMYQNTFSIYSKVP